MKPIQFRQANRELQPSGQQYSENVSGVMPLPVWTDGEQCVSCWEMTWRERISALLFGRVWLALLSGYTQPPALIVAQREYFEEVGD
jgi:hypothetical protein